MIYTYHYIILSYIMDRHDALLHQVDVEVLLVILGVRS